MREIKAISIHCSDSDNPDHDDISVIRSWHTMAPPKGRGWKDVGYHFFIKSDGTVQNGRLISQIPAAVAGFNQNMIAICLHGKGEFTANQFDACAKICLEYQTKYRIKMHNIRGHNFWDRKKTCPNFDVAIIHKRIVDLSAL